MIKLTVRSPISYSKDDLKRALAEEYPLKPSEILDIEILKRTLDLSDKAAPHYKMTLAVRLSLEKEVGMLKMKKRVSEYHPFSLDVPKSNFKSRPYVVGSGPAGLFASLILAESGARPIILERGLDVDKRKEKIALFNKLGILDTECNVQFGEGGAGTYSDGKLKVGGMDAFKNKILSEFVSAGAGEEIMYSSSAHLGTDKLPEIIKNIRNKITRLGGEFHFGARLTDIKTKNGELCEIEYTENGEKICAPADTLFLAVGHSARDVFKMLLSHGVQMESRPFGIGVRVEHPKDYINDLIYGRNHSSDLETASYHLVTHLPSGRSVYSFCMCPGGKVVAASSNEGAVVTNGMSEYARDADNSNSALLVSVDARDFGDGALSGFELQRKIEESAFSLFGDYTAPAIRMDDFMYGTGSGAFGSVKPSYERGICYSDFEKCLPEYIISSLKAGISDFDNWLSGFYLPDATLTGVETRSTSPVRILRNENYCTPSVFGLYPIGEGAGYSGGIVSSAYDGMRAAYNLILENK